eukprot:844412-Prymnesium_polylepis.1
MHGFGKIRGGRAGAAQGGAGFELDRSSRVVPAHLARRGPAGPVALGTPQQLRVQLGRLLLALEQRAAREPPARAALRGAAHAAV